MAKRADVKTSASRIFLVEDHPTFREGLTQILEKEQDLIICGAAGNAADALKAIARVEPDLVLVDITLPGRSGLELIKEIRKTDRKIKLLVLSMHDEALYANRVLRAGGDGYIMKQEDPEEIVHAIRDVLSGHVYVSEDVFATSARTDKNGGGNKTARGGFEELGDSELEMLAMLGQGKTSGEIARHFRVPAQQIDTRCKQMGRKLNLKNSNELIRYAVCWVETGAT